MRVSSDTPPRVIYHLMTQHWGLDAPNLLISVTGGAKNFVMKPRLKNIFRQGLVKVAQTTGKSCCTAQKASPVLAGLGGNGRENIFWGMEHLQGLGAPAAIQWDVKRLL